MQTPLSPEEKTIVLQLLNLQHDAELQPELAAYSGGTALDLSARAKEALLENATVLAEHGLHQLALETYGPLLEQEADPGLTVMLAVSAGLSDEPDLARKWAKRAHAQLVALVFVEEEAGYRFNWHPLQRALQLAKVGRMLGLSETAEVWRSIKPPGPGYDFRRQAISLDCLRLLIELGHDEEAIQLLHQMPLVAPDYGSTEIYARCFRVLLAHDKIHLIWTIIGMTHSDDALALFHGIAIDVAVGLGRHELAIRFARRGRKDQTWSGLAVVATSLVKHGKVQEWSAIWDLLQAPVGSLDHLRFLGNLIEHCPAADREQMLAYATSCAKDMDEFIEILDGVPGWLNDDEVTLMRSYCFVIYAWTKGPAELLAMLPDITLPKDALETILHAALLRGMEPLVAATAQVFFVGHPYPPPTAIWLESKKKDLGLPHDFLEQLVKAYETPNSASAFYNYLDFEEDIDLYFNLRATIIERVGKEYFSSDGILERASSTGDLIKFAQCVRRADAWSPGTRGMHRDIGRCLTARSDFPGRMAEF